MPIRARDVVTFPDRISLQYYEEMYRYYQGEYLKTVGKLSRSMETMQEADRKLGARLLLSVVLMMLVPLGSDRLHLPLWATVVLLVLTASTMAVTIVRYGRALRGHKEEIAALLDEAQQWQEFSESLTSYYLAQMKCK